jgi:hypothetical protein
MGIRWNRTIIASVLSVGCVTLAFVSPGVASASANGADTTSVLTWSEPVPGGGSNAVSCPVKKFCVAVDDGQAFTYNGKKWSAPLNTSEDLLSVSCASETYCVAVDSYGGEETYKGKAFSIPETVAPGVPLGSVSCPSTTFCAAVGGADAITSNGRKWGAPTVIDSGNPDTLLAVSCATSTFCVAVDAGGQAITYNGSTWSSPAVIDSGNQLNAVSCPSTTFCAAVDSAGNILGYNGTVWTAPVNIDGLNYLSSISCRSTALCVSVDYDNYGAYGNIIQTPGAAAGTVLPIDTSDTELTSVSCATDTFCAAVDTYGNYMVSSS